MTDFAAQPFAQPSAGSASADGVQKARVIDDVIEAGGLWYLREGNTGIELRFTSVAQRSFADSRPALEEFRVFAVDRLGGENLLYVAAEIPAALGKEIAGKTHSGLNADAMLALLDKEISVYCRSGIDSSSLVRANNGPAEATYEDGRLVVAYSEAQDFQSFAAGIRERNRMVVCTPRFEDSAPPYASIVSINELDVDNEGQHYALLEAIEGERSVQRVLPPEPRTVERERVISELIGRFHQGGFTSAQEFLLNFDHELAIAPTQDFDADFSINLPTLRERLQDQASRLLVQEAAGFQFILLSSDQSDLFCVSPDLQSGELLGFETRRRDRSTDDAEQRLAAFAAKIVDLSTLPLEAARKEYTTLRARAGLVHYESGIVPIGQLRALNEELGCSFFDADLRWGFRETDLERELAFLRGMESCTLDIETESPHYFNRCEITAAADGNSTLTLRNKLGGTAAWELSIDRPQQLFDLVACFRAPPNELFDFVVASGKLSINGRIVLKREESLLAAYRELSGAVAVCRDVFPAATVLGYLNKFQIIASGFSLELKTLVPHHVLRLEFDAFGLMKVALSGPSRGWFSIDQHFACQLSTATRLGQTESFSLRTLFEYFNDLDAERAYLEPKSKVRPPLHQSNLVALLREWSE